MNKNVTYWGGGIIVSIILIILTATYLSLQQTEQENVASKKINTVLQQVQTRQELRVGMLRSLTPFYINYRHPNKMSGFDHALLTKFSDSLNVKLKIVLANSLPELFEKMKDGTIDLIAEETQGYTEYQDRVLASIPYHKVAQQVVYRKGSTKPYSFNDITGQLVVAEHSPQNLLLNNIASEYPELTWQNSTTFNQEELLKLVADKEIDYTIADSLTVSLMQRIYPSLTIAFTAIKNQPVCWYFAKQDDKTLVERANQFIKTAQNNETIKQLDSRYFSHMNSFDYVDTRAFIKAIEHTLPKYRELFEHHAQKNNFDWRLIAAMAYQESHWNPRAISSTGVRGMMMLTQTTAKSLGVTNRLNAEQSIRGGTEYLKQMVSRVPKSVPEEERVWFALAAYNMGFGHLLDARRLAVQLGKNPDRWMDIKQVLPLLSEEEYYTNLKYGSARGYQALHFVRSIQQYQISLAGYLLEKEHRQKEIDAKIQLATNNL